MLRLFATTFGKYKHFNTIKGIEKAIGTEGFYSFSLEINSIRENYSFSKKLPVTSFYKFFKQN